MKQVRIGVIGAGWMARAHTMAFRSALSVFSGEGGVPEFELIADQNEALARQGMENLGYRRCTANWLDVVRDDKVDLVLVLTPNSLHYEMVKAALENKKHVFCEKPLSISAEQTRELAALAAEAGVVNYVGFSNLLNPANAYVRDLVQFGRLGTITRINATYDQDMLLDPAQPITWRHKRSMAGSGALGDLCSHMISVSQMILGDMAEVSALCGTVIPKRPVAAGSQELAEVENEDIVAFLARYRSGVIGTFGSSRIAAGRKNYFAYEIQGTEGSVSYDLERMCEVQVYFTSDAGRDCGYRRVYLNPVHEGFSAFQPAGGIAIGFDDMKVLQANQVLSAVTKGSGYPGSFAMSAKVDSVIEAVLAAAESRKWVSVAE